MLERNMILKIPEIEIPPEKPFSNDKLQLEIIAERLTILISSIKHPFVFAIDSPWGTGKTTFIKMWKQYLENLKFPTIYYNAWENDYSEDAFLSIFVELESGLKILKKKFELKDDVSYSLEKAKKVGFHLAKNILPAIIKTASQGFIDIKSVNDEAISEALENITKQLFEKYEASKDNRIKFRSLLANFITKLSETENIKNKPLVIFIDELDRCRPSFAIEILEKTKHFFNIDGIIFVLSIDKDQLQKSFKTIYNNEMLVDGYTRRFIDLEYRLPLPNTQNYLNFLTSDQQFKEVLAAKFVSGSLGEFIEVNVDIIDFFELSLREQNQYFVQLTLYIRMVRDRTLTHIPFVCFLLILKNKHRDIYNSLKNEELTPDNILIKIDLWDKNKRFIKSRTHTVLIAYLLFSKLRSYDDKADLSKYEDIINNKSGSYTEIDKANNIIREFQKLRYELVSGDKILHSIFNRIEMLSDFILE